MFTMPNKYILSKILVYLDNRRVKKIILHLYKLVGNIINRKQKPKNPFQKCSS